jgi:outer membrane murein-binding lipoprotein Lpp
MQMIRKTMFIAVVVSVLVAGCAPGQTPDQIAALVETSVASTVQAQNNMGTAVALTVNAQMPTPTETLTPTTVPLNIPTLTPIIDTPTPFVVVSSGGGSSGGSSGSGGGSSTTGKKSKYACTLIAQVPQDGSRATILKEGDTLDVKWTFRNDGTITWDPTWPWEFLSSSVDTNVSDNFGLTMSSIGAEPSLGEAVLKNNTITLGVHLTAPTFQGREPIHIGTAWTVIGDGIKLCVADINIEVIQPGMTP